MCQNHLEDLLNHRFLDLPVSDSIDLGWRPKIGSSNKFPGNADTDGWGHTLRTTTFKLIYVNFQLIILQSTRCADPQSTQPEVLLTMFPETLEQISPLFCWLILFLRFGVKTIKKPIKLSYFAFSRVLGALFFPLCQMLHLDVQLKKFLTVTLAVYETCKHQLIPFSLSLSPALIIPSIEYI